MLQNVGNWRGKNPLQLPENQNEGSLYDLQGNALTPLQFMRLATLSNAWWSEYQWKQDKNNVFFLRLLEEWSIQLCQYQRCLISCPSTLQARSEIFITDHAMPLFPDG